MTNEVWLMELARAQRVINRMWANVFALYRARAITRQVAPFRPVRIFGWAPGYRKAS